MSIYHLNAKIFGRGDGVSIIARAAYRSGTRMRDPETGRTFNYRRKKEVAFTEISLCANAPISYLNRQTLWASVQKVEKPSNAQFAREIEVAIPIEFTREQQINVLREFIHENFTSKGMICDRAIHDKAGNPHAHLLLTMRPVKEDGTWGPKKLATYVLDPETGERIPVIDPKTGQQKKDRHNRLQWKRITAPSTDWNCPETFARWRTGWADACNRELEKIGAEMISEKSYRDRGIDRESTIHEGYAARKIEAMGGISERCEINRTIRKKNRLLEEIRTRLSAIQKEIALLVQERKRAVKKLLELTDDGQHVSQDITR